MVCDVAVEGQAHRYLVAVYALDGGFWRPGSIVRTVEFTAPAAASKRRGHRPRVVRTGSGGAAAPEAGIAAAGRREGETLALLSARFLTVPPPRPKVFFYAISTALRGFVEFSGKCDGYLIEEREEETFGRTRGTVRRPCPTARDRATARVADRIARITAFSLPALALTLSRRERGHSMPASSTRSNRYFLTPSSQARMPFCTCMRLAACWTTTLCGPSSTSSVTSSPRRRGQAVHEDGALCAWAISAALTW